MSIPRILALISFVVAIFLAAPRLALAQSCSGPFFVEQVFPTTGPEETRWRICWQVQTKHGLVITSAHFRKSPTSPWIRVFWDARVAEIFVPYHVGTPRYYDVMGFTWPSVTLTPAHCPASVGGMLLGSPPQVCKEVRDRGLAWNDDSEVRRGEHLVLWSALDAANYNYIIEWTFRDDGVIRGRVGATAVNLPSRRTVAHTHDPTWRLDIDLDGFTGDSAHLGTHTEAGLTATDTAPLIDEETGLEWNPLHFHTLYIHDAGLKNARGSASAYHLMPLRWGTARHDEPFTQKDFWVTRYKPTEIFAAPLPSYITPPESVSSTDIVVWYTGSAHHLVRDEDGEDVSGVWEGLAHVMWAEFMLMPHNLFDKTPLFP
jgi:primary-amine oxidase